MVLIPISYIIIKFLFYNTSILFIFIRLFLYLYNLLKKYIRILFNNNNLFIIGNTYLFIKCDRVHVIYKE